MPFSPKANFVHGEPLMVDYTNSGTSAVNAGDILTINNSLRIAHADIPVGALGALAAGGGVYDVTYGGTNTVAISDGNLVRWDGTNLFAVGGTVTANLKLGACVGGVGTGAASVRVEHAGTINL